MRRDLPSLPKPTTPITPVDKTGTSMRMLLHDTQAHLEKFAGKVDSLVSEVDDARKKTVEATNLVQSGQERLVGEMVDLGAYMLTFPAGMNLLDISLPVVDRSQNMLQKSISQQTEYLRNATKDIVNLDRRVESLDKSLNAMHMVEAHSFSPAFSIEIYN